MFKQTRTLAFQRREESDKIFFHSPPSLRVTKEAFLTRSLTREGGRAIAFFVPRLLPLRIKRVSSRLTQQNRKPNERGLLCLPPLGLIAYLHSTKAGKRYVDDDDARSIRKLIRSWASSSGRRRRRRRKIDASCLIKARRDSSD